jgi:hypothetical protein
MHRTQALCTRRLRIMSGNTRQRSHSLVRTPAPNVKPLCRDTKRAQGTTCGRHQTPPSGRADMQLRRRLRVLRRENEVGLA